MKKNNCASKTDLIALDALKDEEIDYSEIPELSDDFFAKAALNVTDNAQQNLIAHSEH